MSKFYIKNRKILIVGGAGFIGHNLAIKLKSLGANVRVIDSLTVNNLYSIKKNKKEVPFQKLSLKILNERFLLLKKNKISLDKIDARDYFKLSRYINYFKPQVIIHLAAVSHANRSNKDPHSTFDHSLRTLENSLDNAKNNIEQFIFLSSSMVYGNFLKKEVKESDVCDPIGIYGALKFSAEKIIKAYGQIFNLPYTIIRPSALYGERCISRRVGQIFIESALNKSKIIINGDGKEKLDFTYIDDLLNGIICSIKSKNSLQETFNITYGNSRTINKLLGILEESFSNIDIIYKKRDKLMPIRGTLSVSKAQKLIKFKSKWPLEKGYLKYIDWYKRVFKNLI
tara:strand:+ start:95 stop:1117 length:1023 start_codon:yes stop_codon:yes gene_type:complete